MWRYMVLSKKQDNGNNKKEQGKKETNPKESAGKGSILNKDKNDAEKNTTQKQEKKEAIKKDIAIVKDKKEIAKKEPKKDQPARKEKVNYIELVRKFLKGAFNELKKVTWPGRKTIIIYTSVVVVTVLFVAALIWIFDSALSFVMSGILNR
jgi:preprotein translocase subunit SecE